MTFADTDEAEEQAMLDLFYQAEEGEVFEPEVLTEQVTGEEGVWGKVSTTTHTHTHTYTHIHTHTHVAVF